MKALISIADFGEAFAVSRSTAYRLIGRGEIPIVRIGRSVRIRREDAESWFESLSDGRSVHSGASGSAIDCIKASGASNAQR